MVSGPFTPGCHVLNERWRRLAQRGPADEERWLLDVATVAPCPVVTWPGQLTLEASPLPRGASVPGVCSCW